MKKVLFLVTGALMFVLAARSARAQCPQSLHVGEVGKAILHFPNPQPPNPAPSPLFSLSGLTVEIEFERPDGTLAMHSATVEGSGTSCPDAFAPTNAVGGCDTYSLVAGDLTLPGDYLFQWCVCSASPCSCAITSPTLVVKTEQCVSSVGASF
ncbi:MAG: hypothetical protein WBQ86_09710 [Candidatus Binatus sp.]